MSRLVRVRREGRLELASGEGSDPALTEREEPANRDRLRHPWMRFAGKVEVDDPDASRSVDEVVYGRERP